MKKSKNNVEIKTVGVAAHSDPHSRGITLIALIITIIVMIILVGVTVSVALNGGLFDIAKQAAEETQYQADYEILQVAVVAAMASEEGITQESLQENLPSDWTVTGTGPFTVKSPSGNVFTVRADGSIISQTGEGTEDETEFDDLAVLRRYFLGESGEGKNLNDIEEELWDEETGKFIDDPNTSADESNIIIPDSEKYAPLYDLIEELMEDLSDFYYAAFVEYNDGLYALGFDYDLETIKDVELLYKKTGREGEKYLLDIDGDGTEEECTILYDYGEGQGIEVIAPSVVGDTLSLGYKSSAINWEDSSIIEKADLDDDNSLTNTEKAIYSYNYAVEILNDFCKEQVTNGDIPKDNIRSVGTNPDDPYNDETSFYTAEYVQDSYNNVVKVADMNCYQDILRICYYDLNIGESYWLASRHFQESVSGAQLNFGIRRVYYSSYGYHATSFTALLAIRYSSGTANAITDTSDINNYSVRPVIKIDGV